MEIKPDVEKYLKDVWPTLPKLVKRIILENTYQEVVQQAIAGTGVVADEELVGAVSLEVLLVLIELQDPDDFEEYLKSGEILSEEKGEQIAEEISNKLFSSLIHKNTHGVDLSSSPLLVRIQKDEKSLARYEKFPQEVQRVISSISEDVLNGVFKGLSISSEQQDKLMDAVVKVVVGFMTTGEFKKYTQDTLTISLRTTDNIFHKIDAVVFSPVREGLLVAFGEKDGNPTVGVTHDPYREPVE